MFFIIKFTEKHVGKLSIKINCDLSKLAEK